MKEVTIETQRVETHTLYEAVDGTRFCSKDECEKYENSAKGVLRGKLKSLMANLPVNADWLWGGDDNHSVVGVRMATEADKDNVIQNYYLDQPWMLKDTDYSKKSKEEFLALVEQAYNDNDLLLFGLNCDDELYVIDTRLNIIRKLNDLDRKETQE